MKKLKIFIIFIVSMIFSLGVFIIDFLFVHYQQNHFFCESIDYGMAYEKVVELLENEGAYVEILNRDAEYIQIKAVFDSFLKKHIYGDQGVEILFKNERLLERNMIVNKENLVSYYMCSSYPRY